MENRVYKLRTVMQEKGVDAFLISKAENIYYLSGFTGGADARLLLDYNNKYIITDGRYKAQVKNECQGWELIESRTLGLDRLKDFVIKYNSLGIESHNLTYAQVEQLRNLLTVKLIPLEGLIEAQRLIKDAAELQCLRQAAAIGDKVFTAIQKQIKPGITERDLANQIVFLLRKYGCEREAFETIALAGENAALPHGHPGDRILKSYDMVTMDYGGFWHGYAGDMTRTLAVDKADKKLKDYYNIVLEAQLIGVETVSAGVCTSEVDSAVRECLRKYAVEDYFVHSTGHGVGLEIHEAPRVANKSREVLQENMVVTIEPGIYIPGWGGIRIEDTVIVKARGCERITYSDKELLII
jgi:Xaa-Pro aminopeptidase